MADTSTVMAGALEMIGKKNRRLIIMVVIRISYWSLRGRRT